MLLRLLFVILLSLWIVPRLLRLFRSDAPSARVRRPARPEGGRTPTTPLSQQDITDAEFEEIPPQE